MYIIYICIYYYSIYNIRIYIYIYLHNQYIYVSILDKKPILSIIYIKNVCHGKAGVVTRLSTTKRAKNHWDQPRTWWLRWGLASNPRRCAGCFWSFAWGHSYYANRYDIYIYVYIIYSLSIIYIYIYIYTVYHVYIHILRFTFAYDIYAFFFYWSYFTYRHLWITAEASELFMAFDSNGDGGCGMPAGTNTNLKDDLMMI